MNSLPITDKVRKPVERIGGFISPRLAKLLACVLVAVALGWARFQFKEC